MAVSGKPGVPSIISASLHVVGNLVSEGDIQIDGQVDGDIKTSIVTIGQSAEVKGEILAESVTVNGKVYGTIRARTVLMGKTAHVEGDVYHETLAIEAGAYFEGAVRKLSKFQQQQTSKPMDAAKALPPSGIAAMARPAAN